MKVVLEPTKELLIVMCGSNHFSKHKDDPHFSRSKMIRTSRGK